MILGGSLGSSTKTGLYWEESTDLTRLLSMQYKICPMTSELISLDTGAYQQIFNVPKWQLYTLLKNRFNLDSETFMSKKILGDEVILNANTKTVYVFEKKSQQCAGSVDEKIQTCDFKKKQLQKMMGSVGYQVQYIYLLNEWFMQPQYRDVLEYIQSVGCEYYFNNIPAYKMMEVLQVGH